MGGNSRTSSSRIRKNRALYKYSPFAPAGGGPDLTAADFRLFSESQLEDIILKKLHHIYKEALSRLASVGHSDEAAMRAVLRAGHCYGPSDVLTNIVQNASRFLATTPADVGSGGTGFATLRSLEEYSLTALICLLQNVRPGLSRGDAMVCLLLAQLHLGRACTVDVPSDCAVTAEPEKSEKDEKCANPGNLCTFHAAAAAAGHDAGLFEPASFMRYAMRQGAPGWSASGLPPAAAGVLSCLRAQSWARVDGLSRNAAEGESGVAHTVCRPPAKRPETTAELVESVMKELEGLSVDDNDGKKAVGESKVDTVRDLLRQVQELETQVKERKEWAQQKALQAAKKLSADLTELRVLRMEREDNQRRKKEKQASEDETMKRLSELEGALKKMSLQVDRANAIVRRLELENAEIKAEMEAAKLSASESAKACQELMRKEKRNSKKLESCEKQKEKLLEDIRCVREKIAAAEQELADIKKATKETEAKLREDMKAKERAIALAEEEHRAKEEAKVNSQRRLEELRQKIEIDSQRYKDDIQRLEVELLRLQCSVSAKQPNAIHPTAPDSCPGIAVSRIKDSNPKILHGSKPQQQQSSQRKSRRRECVICMEDEVCILFLPCAHQALCAKCSAEHEGRGDSACPCCRTKIDERIRVYGAAS